MENCAQSPQQALGFIEDVDFDFDSIFSDDEGPEAPKEEEEEEDDDDDFLIDLDFTPQDLDFTPEEYDLTPLESDSPPKEEKYNDKSLIDLALNPQELDLTPLKGPDSSESSYSPKSTLSYEEIERMLMEDVDVDDGAVGGTENQCLIDSFEGILVNVPGSSGSESDSGNCEVASDSAEEEEEEEKKRRDANGEEGDDPVSKKKRRQLRNRESAMMSRERKKMYVKELEMKSKYMESECRRLDYALRCCVAENLALHQRLQMGGPLGVYAAKQESAVLFVESLLLGSLFWLLSIVCVCLSLVPSLQIPNQKEESRLGRGLVLEAVRPKVLANSKNIGPELEYELFIMRRRCRGTRASAGVRGLG